jgi:hypothetical protein
MQVEKIYLDRSKRGDVICPQCRNSKKINASNFKINHNIKVTCDCNHEYYIAFDQRNYNRKKINIKGKFRKTNQKSDFTTEVVIKDLSPDGLNFKTDSSTDLHIDDILQISFVLYDLQRSEIHAKGIVRYVQGPNVGIEFDNLDEQSSGLIKSYVSASTPLNYDKYASLREKIRHSDEALCVKAAREELNSYLHSLNISLTADFSGSSWDEAVSRYRSYWQNHYICSHCHNITNGRTADSSKYICRRCEEGRYTNSPKEIWAIILKNSPQREKYFSLRDAISVFEINIAEFETKYPFGFLVPVRKQLSDSSLITNLKDIYEQSRSMGFKLDKNSINYRPLKRNIRQIRKRNYTHNPEKIMIGRSEINDIVFANRNVSRIHAFLSIKISDNKCSLCDLKSSNGTYLNKQKIIPHKLYKLSNNSEICFGGEVKVVYLYSGVFYKLVNEILRKH